MNSTSATLASNRTDAPADEDRPGFVSRYLPHSVRVLMGLMFTVFGLNAFLNFIPAPPTIPAPAMAFFGALFATGYMIPLIGGTQLVVGVLLLLNRFVALALVLLAPVIVNIIAYHVFLDRSGLVMAGVVTAAELYLAWVHRAAYRPLLSARSK